MELLDVYNSCSNPIENEEVIKKLVELYSKSSEGFDGFYGKLTTTQEKNEKGYYTVQQSDKFYSTAFNKWKNSIVAMTRDEFVELYKNGSYGSDFIKLRNFLKNIPDVKTRKEANDIFNSNYDDKELEDAMEKYKWTSLGEYSSWTHVCSRNLTAKKDKYPIIEHRLYLNTESTDTHEMINLFIEECDKHKLPYYFKFDEYGNRDDTVVIYSSTDTLTQYIEILHEIKKEHPDLVSRAKNPPLLTGKIDSWIGYGSEPARTPDGKNHSFNEIRSKAIQLAIQQITKSWIQSHRKQHIAYNNKSITLEDYIAIQVAEYILSKMKRQYTYFIEDEKEKVQKTGIPFNESDVSKKLGYSISDINSSVVKQNITNLILSKLPVNLDIVIGGKFEDMEAIKMKLRDNQELTFSGNDMRVVFEKLSVKIAAHDPNYLKDVKSQIIDNSQKYGIDTFKYCFDVAAREKLKNKNQQMQQAQEQQNQPKVQVQSTKQQIDITPLQNDMNDLDVQTIIDTLNPELMKKRMKLPNGAEISAKQYIQEIVYPQLPASGFVILDNGSPLSNKQFIEEGVIFECQEKYNGNFPKYLSERTRENFGVVNLSFDDEVFSINPVEITEYINPELMKKRMKLPNGTEISARQYIQEFYAPHIPSNGLVMLSNGTQIHVKQYIEEILMFEGQEKYNGDISQIIYNTTKRNNGIVNGNTDRMYSELLTMRNLSSNQTENMSSGIKR